MRVLFLKVPLLFDLPSQLLHTLVY